MVVTEPPILDSRGSFQRTYERDTFDSNEFAFEPVHVNLSHNTIAGTLRGLHYQVEPSLESKLVTCIRGSVFDVAVDLRRGSSTLHDWFGTTLTPSEGRGLYIPAGFAHGYVTLEDHTSLLYVMGDAYRADLARGIRWDDPTFAIDWPIAPRIISDRDAGFPDFRGSSM